MTARVCYLSAGGHGADMLRYLCTVPCDLVFASTDDSVPNWGAISEYDLGLNFLGTHKIPVDQVNCPRLGWVNFHPAPLPEYKGRNLCYHAIMNCAKEFGATVHYMDEHFDTGPLIEVVRFPIDSRDTAGDLYHRSVEMLRSMFRKWVPHMLHGRVESTVQTPSGSYYVKTRINDHVTGMVTREVERTIRALSFPPKHYARIVIGGRSYKIVPE